MAFSRAASEEPFVLANSTQTTHPTDLHRKEAHTLGLHQREHTHTHTHTPARARVRARVPAVHASCLIVFARATPDHLQEIAGAQQREAP